MGTTIITNDDLREFKHVQIDEIKEILANQSGVVAKKWLRSQEVRELLGISQGTLQNLRINGTIPYTKIGGVLYYDHPEIMQLLEDNRIQNKF